MPSRLFVSFVQSYGAASPLLYVALVAVSVLVFSSRHNPARIVLSVLAVGGWMHAINFFVLCTHGNVYRIAANHMKRVFCTIAFRLVGPFVIDPFVMWPLYLCAACTAALIAVVAKMKPENAAPFIVAWMLTFNTGVVITDWIIEPPTP